MNIGNIGPYPGASQTIGGSTLPSTPTFRQIFTKSGSSPGLYVCSSNGSWTGPLGTGSGSVTSVSVVTANGVSGSVANPTTTPAITLTLGAITPSTVNGLTITPSTGTFTLSNGKTLSVSNTLTFTGTDSSSVAFGAGGTVAYIGVANSWGDGIKQTFNPNATNAGINIGSQTGDPSSLANGDLWYDSTGNLFRARINGASISLGAGITNSAGANVVPKSNGTNLVASQILDDGATVQLVGAAGAGDVQTNATKHRFSVIANGGNLLDVDFDDSGQGMTLAINDPPVGLAILGGVNPNILLDSTIGATTVGDANGAGNGTKITITDSTQTIALAGNITLNKTITAGGTAGAQTINRTTGSVNFAAAATSLVVTNNLVSSTSLVFCQIMTNDTTAKSCQAVVASGSFTIFLNAAAAAETKVAFLVTN